MAIGMARDGGVATVTINRPEKKNAITMEMREAFQGTFQQLQDDPEVRAIVLTGAGGNFSAGGDISDMGAASTFGSMTRMRVMHRLVRAIAQTEKPVIAAVEGVCVGMGWSIALACDFVIAAEDARFQFAFRHVGLAPDAGAAFLLTRHVGLMRAKELIYSGRFVSGCEAAQLGLALEALPSGDALPRACEMAQSFVGAPGIALALAKRQLDAAAGQSLDQALDFEAAMQTLAATTADFKEGTDAFREKRKPKFTGL